MTVVLSLAAFSAAGLARGWTPQAPPERHSEALPALVEPAYSAPLAAGFTGCGALTRYCWAATNSSIVTAKINHHALVYAGLVLRILELAQGSMPICAAAAASLCFTILTLRVRPRASTRALVLKRYGPPERCVRRGSRNVLEPGQARAHPGDGSATDARAPATSPPSAP